MALKSEEAKARARQRQKEQRATPEYREKAAARMREYRAKNPDKLREIERRRYERHREEIKAANAAYRAANPERVAAAHAAYELKRDPIRKKINGAASYERHEADLAPKRAAWRQANRAKMSEYVNRRRARERGFVAHRDWERLLQRYRHACAYCGSTGQLEREHVVPLSRGGRHAIGNLVPACRACNNRKGAMFLSEWKLLQSRMSHA